MSTSRTTPSSRSRNTSTHPTTSHAPTPTSTSTTPNTMFTPRSNTGPIVIMNHPPITTTRIQTQPLPPNFVYISRTPSRPILNPPSHPSQQHRSRFEPPQSNSQEENDPYADLPNLVPSTPPTETERESVQLLRLLQLLQRIQRLEDEEREYREQVDGFRRALGEVERIVAGVERSIGGGEEGEEEEEVQVVQDVLGPWRDMGNPFMRGGSSVRVLEIGADGEVRFPGMEERDGRTSRLGMSFMGTGRVPFEAVDSDGEMIGIPMHSSMFGRGMYEDHVEVEESEDGIDMDHFNTAMSALRLIYQNRRNHGHVRGHFDEDEDEDDADRDWSVEGRREVVASRNGAPLFFEDGYASVLENWMMTLPILDRNGVPVESPMEAMDNGVGFATPEGDGGMGLLWRGYDANGDVRVNSDGEEYVEIIEVNTGAAEGGRCRGGRGCSGCKDEEKKEAEIKYSGMRSGLLTSASMSDGVRGSCSHGTQVGR